MSDRIEPIRRDRTEVSVPPVLRVVRRQEERREEEQRRRRQRPPTPSITRDDDGTPHVDVRA